MAKDENGNTVSKGGRSEKDRSGVRNGLSGADRASGAALDVGDDAVSHALGQTGLVGTVG